jgi:hypothetical protein
MSKAVPGFLKAASTTEFLHHQLRYHQEVLAFPLLDPRVNLSRSGLGFSWGLPMFRTGISADGRKYIWLTIPRTGLSWIKYFGKTPPSATSVTAQQSSPQLPSPQPSTPSAQSTTTPWWKHI